MTLANRAVFLDRDGTINEECGYLNHPDRLRLIEGAPEAVALLNRHGFKTIVVSNQSGVARGYFPEKLLGALHDKIQALLKAHGAALDAIYYCPHHSSVGEPPYRQDCECRKPKLGMIHRAEIEFAVDARRSYMVGDKLSDVEFGKRAGCKTILVLTGYGKGEWEYNREKCPVKPDYVAADVLGAARWIVNDLKNREQSPR
ncbi:HAD family hydrolase [Candidatus Poribacteria bacterium]|nr:HAD family hydrolase [Candidatus Poribacteria bacterium]